MRTVWDNLHTKDIRSYRTVGAASLRLVKTQKGEGTMNVLPNELADPEITQKEIWEDEEQEYIQDKEYSDDPAGNA